MMLCIMLVWLYDAHTFVMPCMMHVTDDAVMPEKDNSVMHDDSGDCTGGCTSTGGAEDAARAARCC